MASPLSIFLSYDLSDADLVLALKKQLAAALPGREMVYWERSGEVDLDRGMERFLEKASLAIIVLSVDYLALGENLLEKTRIMRFERERRPFLAVLVVYARSVQIPDDLLAFAIGPAPDEPVLGNGLDRDRQLFRAARLAAELVIATPEPAPAGFFEPPLTVKDLQERLLPLAHRTDLAPVFEFLKSVARETAVRKSVFELEDNFVEALERARLHKDFEGLKRETVRIREDLRFLIERLEESHLQPKWRLAIFNIERGGHEREVLFLPAHEVEIPQTLNLTVALGAELGAEVGALTLQQQQEFRRLLLLSQDALAMGQFSQAHRYAEQARTQIDPQSAQLYEMLLVSFLLHETQPRIIRDALHGSGRLLQQAALYAGRLRDYHQDGLCPTPTFAYNLAACAEELSDLLWHEYDTLRNDAILDTGKRGEEAGDCRPLVEKLLFTAQFIYRAIFPYQGFLKTLVIELMGGAQAHWVDEVEIQSIAPESLVPGAVQKLRFGSAGNFDVESTILEILQMLDQARPDAPETYKLLRYQLREDVYFRLLAKRKALSDRLGWEKRKLRPYTDVRASVIRYVHTCLLGYRIFGDRGNDPYEQSYLRLALEYLLPELVLADAPRASSVPYDHPRDLRWFDLGNQGEFRTHPDLEGHRFNAYGLVQYMVGAFGGGSGISRAMPGINETIYAQYAEDTLNIYHSVRDELAFTDFRRLPDLDARRQIITCFKRWEVCYLAYPEFGQTYLELILSELAGDGLLLWLYFNPYQLVTQPDSLAMGYDALMEIRRLAPLSTRISRVELQQRTTENLFNKHIKTSYNKIAKKHEPSRTALVSLLIQALNGFREFPQIVYLDFIYSELVEENKLTWVTIGENGMWSNATFQSAFPFDPISLLMELNRVSPERFGLYDMRRRISLHRFSELQELYRREISDIKEENGRPERALVIDIIRKLKGLYTFFPDSSYLELPLRELSGNGLIRWHERFLGFLPTATNHYESNFYNFDFKIELVLVKDLLNRQHELLERVMQETGYINS